MAAVAAVAVAIAAVVAAEVAGATGVAVVVESAVGAAVAGEAVGGTVTGLGLGLGLGSEAEMEGAEAVAGAEVVVGAVGGAEAEEWAEAVGEEGASELGGQLNAGCDVGGYGNHVEGWPLWKPPFSSWCFLLSGSPSSRPRRKWSSPHSGTGHERSLCPHHCLNGLSDSIGIRVCWRSWSLIGCWR